MAGRPPLRIGQHGKITRTQIDKGVWVARCRFRDTDGVTRIVERRSPTTTDQHGKAAEDALAESLVSRRPPAGGEISLDSRLIDLVNAHIDRIEEDSAGATIETYRGASAKLAKLVGGLRVGEATVPRIDAALRSMRTAHGTGQARHARVVLRGGLQLAVMAGVLGSNPARDVSPLTQQARPKGAPQLSPEQFGALLSDLHESEYCRTHDLVDPITMLMATGLRRSELLGLRWPDYDAVAAEIMITGKVVRIKGKGLQRYDQTKTAAGERTLPLPLFAVEMLAARRRTPYFGEQTMIFPSTAGTWRDPSNFGRDWRLVRDKLHLPDVTSHSFRKTVATMIDDEGLSARIGADHLGHAKVSMTQDRYMARGRVHSEVADLLDKRVNR